MIILNKIHFILLIFIYSCGDNSQKELFSKITNSPIGPGLTSGGNQSPTQIASPTPSPTSGGGSSIQPIRNTPPPIPIGNSQAIFVNFTSAEYKITFDVSNSKSNYEATMTFEQAAEGYPVFDVVTPPSEVRINNETTTAPEFNTPDGTTQYRRVDKILQPGIHVLKVKGPIVTNYISYANQAVKVFIDNSDLDNRRFWEVFIPSNGEYDQFPMVLDVEVIGTTTTHNLFTNGTVTNLGTNKFRINFESYANCSCGFFHLTSTNFATAAGTYNSIDGRSIPLLTYALTSDNANQSRDLLLQVLAELEHDYGATLHNKYLVYLNPVFPGGMEYCGATVTQLGALTHEITHSHFARGVMPANGNAGWIDEAIASWRDNHYPSIANFSGSKNLANQGTYRRHTAKLAYSFGRDFMGHLDFLYSSQGGLKPALREFFKTNARKPYSTDNFSQFLSDFYQDQSIKALFDSTVKSGQGSRIFQDEEEMNASNPMHPKGISAEELMKIID